MSLQHIGAEVVVRLVRYFSGAGLWSKRRRAFAGPVTSHNECSKIRAVGQVSVPRRPRPWWGLPSGQRGAEFRDLCVLFCFALRGLVRSPAVCSRKRLLESVGLEDARTVESKYEDYCLNEGIAGSGPR